MSVVIKNLTLRVLRNVKNVIRVHILKREDTFNQIVEFGSYNSRSLHKNTITVKNHPLEQC